MVSIPSDPCRPRAGNRVRLLGVCLCAGMVLGAACEPPGPTVASQPLCEIPFPSPPVMSQGADCPSPDVPERVTGYRTLSPDCDYAGVTFLIDEPETILDCAGQLLYAPDEDDLAEERAAIQIRSAPAEAAPLHHVVVKNCFVRDHHRAVDIARPLTRSEKNQLRETYWATETDPHARDAQLGVLDDALRALAPRDIVIRDVHARETRHVGFYVYNYVQRVTLDDISVRDNAEGPGIYLDSGSRQNRIQDSCLARTAREGIAIDASAFNEILGSRFEDNEEGGIFLYKNAFEQPDKHIPRTQHSEGNQIAENTFVDEERAIWVASRAARNYRTPTSTTATRSCSRALSISTGVTTRSRIASSGTPSSTPGSRPSWSRTTTRGSRATPSRARIRGTRRSTSAVGRASGSQTRSTGPRSSATCST